jgi:hypothetical protein
MRHGNVYDVNISKEKAQKSQRSVTTATQSDFLNEVDLSRGLNFVIDVQNTNQSNDSDYMICKNIRVTLAEFVEIVLQHLKIDLKRDGMIDNIHLD